MNAFRLFRDLSSFPGRPSKLLLLYSVNCSQFIVGEDGTCGLVYEHAPAEGPPIVFLIDYVVKYM